MAKKKVVGSITVTEEDRIKKTSGKKKNILLPYTILNEDDDKIIIEYTVNNIKITQEMTIVEYKNLLSK